MNDRKPAPIYHHEGATPDYNWSTDASSDDKLMSYAVDGSNANEALVAPKEMHKSHLQPAMPSQHARQDSDLTAFSIRGIFANPAGCTGSLYCLLCDRVFLDMSRLTSHFCSKHHNGGVTANRATCALCKKSFKKLQGLDGHSVSVHSACLCPVGVMPAVPNAQLHITCPVRGQLLCSDIFHSKAQVKTHLEDKHAAFAVTHPATFEILMSLYGNHHESKVTTPDAKNTQVVPTKPELLVDSLAFVVRREGITVREKPDPTIADGQYLVVRGLPSSASTIGLATAMQELGLYGIEIIGQPYHRWGTTMADIHVPSGVDTQHFISYLDGKIILQSRVTVLSASWLMNWAPEDRSQPTSSLKRKRSIPTPDAHVTRPSSAPKPSEFFRTSSLDSSVSSTDWDPYGRLRQRSSKVEEWHDKSTDAAISGNRDSLQLCKVKKKNVSLSTSGFFHDDMEQDCPSETLDRDPSPFDGEESPHTKRAKLRRDSVMDAVWSGKAVSNTRPHLAVDLFATAARSARISDATQLDDALPKIHDRTETTSTDTCRLNARSQPRLSAPSVTNVSPEDVRGQSDSNAIPVTSAGYHINSPRPQPDRNDTGSHGIYVSNLPYKLNSGDELPSALSAEGTVRRMFVRVNVGNGRPLTCAKVQFSTRSEAEQALVQLHGTHVGGQVVSVRPAHTESGVAPTAARTPHLTSHALHRETARDPLLGAQESIAGRILRISNLAKTVTQRDLKGLFTDILVQSDGWAAISHVEGRDYAYVTTTTTREARHAARNLNGILFHGQNITVCLASQARSAMPEQIGCSAQIMSPTCIDDHPPAGQPGHDQCNAFQTRDYVQPLKPRLGFAPLVHGPEPEENRVMHVEPVEDFIAHIEAHVKEHIDRDEGQCVGQQDAGMADELEEGELID